MSKKNKIRNNRTNSENQANKGDSFVMTVDEILKNSDESAEEIEQEVAEESADVAEEEEKENTLANVFRKREKKKKKRLVFSNEDEDDIESEDYEDYDDYDEEVDELDLEDPVRMGEWVLSIFLASVPVINLICLLVWAFGPNNKPSKKTWARAKLVWLLVITVLFFIVAAFFIGLLMAGGLA